MFVYTQSFNPNTIPAGYVGQPYGPVEIHLLPNGGSLSSVAIVGASNGMTATISDADNNKFVIAGTPTSAPAGGGNVPIVVRTTNSAYAVSEISF